MSETPTDAWWLRAPEPTAGRPPVALTTTRRLDDLELVEVPDAGPAPAPPAPAPSPAAAATPRRRRPRDVRAAVAAGVAALAAGGASAVMLLPPDAAPTAAPVRVVVVDPAGVHATASSTQDDAGSITYGAANTLDGDPATAWNSDGAKDRPGHGLRLVYTFASPVELRSITLLNGYQKVRPRPGHAPVDLFPLNARVHRVRVVTDAGAWTWDLADTRAPQTFAKAVGRTSSVRLEIVTAYPGKSYPDVAVSEASFTAAVTG